MLSDLFVKVVPSEEQGVGLAIIIEILSLLHGSSEETCQDGKD